MKQDNHNTTTMHDILHQPKPPPVEEELVSTAVVADASAAVKRKVEEAKEEIRPATKRRRTSHVHFSTKVHIYHKEVNQEDLHNAWYSRHDFARFENERRETVWALHDLPKGSYLDSNRYTLRGLDAVLTQKASLLRKAEMKRLIKSVLEQTRNGAKDEDVRAVSCYFSKSSRQRGLLRGYIAQCTEKGASCKNR